MATPVGTSFWRVAGVSYLKYVQITSQCVRNCIKDKSKLAQRNEFHFRERVWKDGVQGERVLVEDVLSSSPLLQQAPKA